MKDLSSELVIKAEVRKRFFCFLLFRNNGWICLRDEMKMELERISSRNLGRDDRYENIFLKASTVLYLEQE